MKILDVAAYCRNVTPIRSLVPAIRLSQNGELARRSVRARVDRKKCLKYFIEWLVVRLQVNALVFPLGWLILWLSKCIVGRISKKTYLLV